MIDCPFGKSSKYVRECIYIYIYTYVYYIKITIQAFESLKVGITFSKPPHPKPQSTLQQLPQTAKTQFTITQHA